MLINVYNVDKRLAVSFVVCLSSTRLPRQCQQRLLGIPNMGYYAGNSGYLFLFIYLSCSLILPSSKNNKIKCKFPSLETVPLSSPKPSLNLLAPKICSLLAITHLLVNYYKNLMLQLDDNLYLMSFCTLIYLFAG